MQQKECIVDSVDHIIIKENGKIGLKKVCKGRYSYGEVYSDWLDTWVEKCDPFEEEHVIIPCLFDKITSIDDDYFLVGENEKWGLYSVEAKLLSPMYNELDISESSEKDIRIVKADGKRGLCCLYGMILAPVYKKIEFKSTADYFINIVKADGKLGLCCRSGYKESKMILKPLYDNIELSALITNGNDFSKNTVCLVKADGRYGACRYKSGEACMALDPVYTDIRPANEMWNILIVRNADGKTGVFAAGSDHWILEPQDRSLTVVPAFDNKGYQTSFSVIISDGSRFGLIYVCALKIKPEYPWRKVARAALIHFNERLKKPRKP